MCYLALAKSPHGSDGPPAGFTVSVVPDDIRSKLGSNNELWPWLLALWPVALELKLSPAMSNNRSALDDAPPWFAPVFRISAGLERKSGNCSFCADLWGADWDVPIAPPGGGSLTPPGGGGSRPRPPAPPALGRLFFADPFSASVPFFVWKISKVSFV